MCERCTIFKGVFGSRDPLPPRIASLDVDSTVALALKIDKSSVGDVHGTELNPLGPSDITNSVALPFDPTSAGTQTSTILAPQEKKVTGSSAIFRALPTNDPNSRLKWSDVVVLGSEALQSPATAKAPEVTVPYSVLVAIMTKEDILDTLMLNCPDFPTLFSLVASCKTAKCTFERHSQGIINAMLRKIPQELRYLTIALIGINGSQIENSRSIKTLMETWLGMEPKPLAERLQKDPFDVIRKLARSFSAIDLFMEVIPKNCVNNFADYKKIVASRKGLDYFIVTQASSKHPLLDQTEWSDVPDDTEWDIPHPLGLRDGPAQITLPLTDRETYRIKRALLRYEIFCALFYLGPDGYFDTRHHPHRFNQDSESSLRQAFHEDQFTFLNKYVNAWEVGELAVVTHFIYDLVRNAYFLKYKTLRYEGSYKPRYGHWGNSYIPHNRHTDHAEVVDEFENHLVWFASQGLSLLRKIYHDRTMGYSALLEKYGEPHYRLAECFVPFSRCTDRRGFWFASDPNISWEPRATWSDTPGMERPSKGWLARSPVVDDEPENSAYWGNKWMRKFGYFIWDRD